jgi:hypothetical protein
MLLFTGLAVGFEINPCDERAAALEGQHVANLESWRAENE